MPQTLRVIPPNPELHREAIYDLTAKCFNRHAYWDWQAFCRQGYFEHGFYDWNAARIGFLGETLVTHVGVWDYQMCVGVGRLRVGGIGSVATHGEYRRRGLMSRTLRASLAAIRERGFDVSILFGARNIYHLLGYVPAWPYESYVVSAEDLPSERPAGPLRAFQPGSRPDVDDLHNREFAPYVGTAVRPTYRRNRWSKLWRGNIWTDARGRCAGHVVFWRDGQVLTCIDETGGAEQVLRVFGALCRALRCTQARFGNLPHDHPLARRLRRGNCRVETDYIRSGGPMIRTINLRFTLEKLSRELSRRLSASSMAGWSGRLEVADPRERVLLDIGSGRVKVSSRPGRTRHTIRGGEEIAQLLIGTQPPDETIEAGEMKPAGDGRALVEAIFPHCHPTLARWDSF